MKVLLATLCLTIAVLFGSAGAGYALPPCPEKGLRNNCYGSLTWANGDTYDGEFQYAKAADASWTYYKNGRFGFKVSYPTSLFTVGPEPENSDGRVFTSDDGRASFTASGSYNALFFTPRTYIDWFKNLKEYVDTVTYERAKRNWVVLSGYRGDMVYYKKTIFSCGNQVLNTVHWEYPKEQKHLYDPLVGPIAKSLVPGTGWGTPVDC